MLWKTNIYGVIEMLAEFVVITLAVASGIILGASVLFAIAMSPKMINWYMKKTKEVVMKSFEM